MKYNLWQSTYKPDTTLHFFSLRHRHTLCVHCILLCILWIHILFFIMFVSANIIKFNWFFFYIYLIFSCNEWRFTYRITYCKLQHPIQVWRSDLALFSSRWEGGVDKATQGAVEVHILETFDTESKTQPELKVCFRHEFM